MKINETGNEYGILKVIEECDSPANDSSAAYWACRCKCGNVVNIRGSNLRLGRRKSCGCMNSKINISQGKIGKKEASLHWGRVRRCYEPTSAAYKNYGARGVIISDEWNPHITPNAVHNLLEYMGGKPAPDYSIDRINTSGSYVPGNVRWATDETQLQNRLDSKRWVIDGRMYQSNREASRILGVSRASIRRWCKGCSVDYPTGTKYYPPRDNCCSFPAYYKTKRGDYIKMVGETEPSILVIKDAA